VKEDNPQHNTSMMVVLPIWNQGCCFSQDLLSKENNMMLFLAKEDEIEIMRNAENNTT
jgi:hypothetical protein